MNVFSIDRNYYQTLAQIILITLVVLPGLGQAQTTHSSQEPGIGKVVFVVGEAQLERAGKKTSLSKGQEIHQGDNIQTGSDGHVHLRMNDRGFIGIRASSRLLLQDYTYRPEAPEENKVRLNLESGVVRTVSGKAGELARERYRFNTPIAAIGLRGTDYVVYASADSTRVSVLRGEITVSPLGNGCAADALSPCSGALTRILNARTPHAYLEVRDRGVAPELILQESGKDSPSRIAPPHPEEPRALIESPLSTAHASAALNQVPDSLNQVPDLLTEKQSVVTTLPSTPPEKRPEVVWGRWQSLTQLGTPTVVSLLADDREVTFGNELFALLRPAGHFSQPESGQVALNYAGGEAHIRGSDGNLVPVILRNGQLALDFNVRQFDTAIIAGGAPLHAQGKITFQGYFASDPARSNMNVLGTLSSGANEAGYLFDTPMPEGKKLIGATRWKR